jgi:nucleoside-diphosphate-sugar epimerase
LRIGHWFRSGYYIPFWVLVPIRYYKEGMTPPKTIAVHAATGAQGAPVAALLTDAGHRVRPVSRASGVDLLDRLSLEAAYAGADAVVLQLPLVYDERALIMGENAARAAEAAGVAHLVINTGGVLPPGPIGVPYIDARLRASAADVQRVTVLQPTTTYMENLSAPWAAARIVRDGVVAYPVPPEAPLRWVATADVAVAVERAISRQVAGWFPLPGDPLTGHELVDALGRAIGRGVRWQTIAPRELADLLRPFLGDHAADGTAAFYEMLASAPPMPLPDAGPAREALGWAPRDVETWAREVTWPLLRAA